METWFTFFLKKGGRASLALKELSSCKIQHESVQKDFETGVISICAVAEESLFPTTWKQIDSYIKLPTSEINWADQWISFSPYFKEGLCQIPLSLFSDSKETLLLNPGPGFGDLSHPTTSLVLELMGPFIQEKTILDLGCGSGILGIGALKLKAFQVYSLDIDPLALSHTIENGKLNQVEEQLFVSDHLPANLSSPPTVLLLNMIFSEQKKALSSLSKKILDSLSFWIVSGILEEEKESYLSWATSQGLSLQASQSKEGWIGLVFKTNN